MKTVYLDNSATTQMRPEVIETITRVMHEVYANASSTYSIGRKAKSEIELVRKNIAQSIGVSSSEIVFTSGGTEANNLILNSLIRDLGVKRIITSKIEHHAVLNTIEVLSSQYNVVVEYVNFTEEGDISIESIKKLLEVSDELTLVSLMHINNEIGTILDLEVVGNLCETYNAYFHSDTVQSVGHYKLDLKKAKVHFATASTHKFYGPKGIGFAYLQQNLKVKSSQYGGEQERGLRAGTEAVPLIVAMGEALEKSYSELKKDQNHIASIKEYAALKLLEQIPEIKFNAESNRGDRNYNLLNVCLPVSSEKASTILFQLDLVGICCSRGSACQSGSNKPSHVLAEILPKEKLKFTSLRLSFSIYTTKNEIDYLVEQLQKLVS